MEDILKFLGVRAECGEDEADGSDKNEKELEKRHE